MRTWVTWLRAPQSHTLTHQTVVKLCTSDGMPVHINEVVKKYIYTDLGNDPVAPSKNSLDNHCQNRGAVTRPGAAPQRAKVAQAAT